MTETSRFGPVREELDGQVAAGRIPGWAAGIRCGGVSEVLYGGERVLGAAPVEADTLFRIASVSKLVSGALTLALVTDGVLGLDDDIARWLPELAEPRVLTDPGGPLEDTVAARRPITVRHLLTCTAGLGYVPQSGPLQDTVAARGLAPGPVPPAMTPDEYVSRVAELPLAGQPGETWNYSSDLLSVLLARAGGRPLGELVAERVTGPLGLDDTGFAGDPARLAAQYVPTDAGLQVFDPPDGAFSRPPVFPSLAGGLVSTAGDVLAFLGALASGGEPLLPAASVADMTRDALSPQLRAAAEHILGPGRSWGLMVAVEVERTRPWRSPGRWGWDGGTGTSAWVDPSRDLVAVLLTQRMMTGPHDSPDRFWAALDRCA